MLKDTGVLREPTPGPTEVEDVKRGSELDRRKVELVMRRAEVDLKDGEEQVRVAELLGGGGLGGLVGGG